MTKNNPGQAKLQQAAVRFFAERGSADMSVRDLAAFAGVSRGTIYNNLKNPELLFEEVAVNLADEMHQRIRAILEGIDDPAMRLSVGIRLFLRRAHEEPHWGRFIVRFSFANSALKAMWLGPPAEDLQEGVKSGRYTINPQSSASLLAMIGGGVLGAMLLVLEGHKTWRDAGTDAVEFALRGLGLSDDDARMLASSDLPPLLA